MNVMICGAGRITDELLKRVGAGWEITLIEKEEARLAPFASRFPSLVRVVAGDASSPVVLEKSGLAAQDCILAMTDDDPVNLAIVRFAREAGVKNVLAIVRNPEVLPEFRRLDAWTISMVTDAARKVYQFLKDPRIRIIDLGEGEGELLELTVGRQDLPRLGDIASQRRPEWRMVGLLRENRMLFADDIGPIEAGDRLLFIGKAEMYNTLSSRLSQNRPHFPRTYGRRMILGIEEDPALDVTELLNEAFYLAQGTQIEQITAVYAKKAADISQSLLRWSESLQIDLVEEERKITKRTVSVARENDAGIVLLAHLPKSFFQSFLGKGFADTARQLPCPLLLAKSSDPYERVLVPFNGSLAGQRALEIAMDLSRQLDAAVGVVIVVEPAYLRGEASSSGKWENAMLKQVRELSHIHKIKVEEHVRHGNPVKEVVAAAADCQLVVIGIEAEESGFFSLDVAGMLADRSPCSVLLVS